MFTNAFNTTSLCSPSRASILTGQYASTHGVRNNHTPWTGESATFLEHLGRSGYAMAFVGKWHMPGEGLPDLPGVDLFVSYTHREGQGAYFDCPLVVNGEPEPSRKRYITEEMTDRAMMFIEQTRRVSNPPPFCIYLSHRAAHPPFKAPDDVTGMYDDAVVDMPPKTDPLWFGKTAGNVFQGVMMGTYPAQYRKYCETITAMDRDIARLLAWLDEKDLARNTVVIYMADNGMQWGEHGRHGIREPYEESIRIPMIWRVPGTLAEPGTRREQMTLNIDIAPTLLDLAGLPQSAAMEGLSLVPWLADRHRPGREDFLLEFWKYYPENTPSYVGVRTTRHKYIEFARGREPWLFDLQNDQREQNNLFATPAGRAVLPDLRRRLARLRRNEG